ncbi:MAG: hypothetical protein DWQ07_03235 [Chloroflexi bacterium]|nr:MAG: hypothetical protein DWQ07_03235 [Chloroflexota bacterium]MBL1193486.1 hypothetical protein [Chloroflexota bacterium]NOH10777.1 hypothetical protein [Chloroflexota bacterium]
MTAYSVPPNNQRIGFHYFPDTQHYRQEDLDLWLPRLQSLSAQWLTLITPKDRAVPEFFLQGLLDAGVEPILHFNVSLAEPPTPDDLQLLMESYERWGVHYVCLFDQPNCHEQWKRASWAQVDLVERFLDIYLPLAEEVVGTGLHMVFPPLKPGGDYWDTAFLRAALSSIQKRGHDQVLNKLVLGAYASANHKSLDWGAGGPERWPGAQPYYTPEEEQDQRGFYIFDWYNTITQAALGHTLPTMLFKAGCTLSNPEEAEEHSQHNLQVVELLNLSSKNPNPVSENVLGANFWILSAPEGSPPAKQAWYQEDGTALPVVEALISSPIESFVQAKILEPLAETEPENTPSTQDLFDDSPAPASKGYTTQKIDHYLLLPTFEWGVNDWHLDVIRGFVKSHQPTVGFSLEEAAQATRVTVIGSEKDFPDAAVSQLRNAGCIVRQVSGDGTSIASQLASID